VHIAGAATAITMQPLAEPIGIYFGHAVTQITFSVRGNVFRVMNATGATQISFSVQGQLLKTWQEPGPCFEPCNAGTWTQEFPPWTERLAA